MVFEAPLSRVGSHALAVAGLHLARRVAEPFAGLAALGSALLRVQDLRLCAEIRRLLLGADRRVLLLYVQLLCAVEGPFRHMIAASSHMLNR